MAEWMGYPSAEAMNHYHDDWHRVLCRWMDTTSLALKVASGEPITPEQSRLAELEENAVLHLQRFARGLLKAEARARR